MAKNYGNDDKSALQAKTDAQKIAFAPIMFQAAKALRDFGILSFLRKNKDGKTTEEIAQEAKISNYGATVLLEAGLSLEMIMLKDGKYFLTKTGYFIIADKLTRVNMDFTHDVNYKGFYHLQEAIKKGKPTGLHKEFGNWATVYEALAEMPEKFRESWFGFDHYYSDDSFPQVMPVVFQNNPKKIMDVGGNTGKFALKCAEYNKDVQVTILDLPGQLNDANKNIKEKGFENRIQGHPINLLDFSKPYPKGYDVIWMSQFLDCFSEEEVVNLISNAHDAMDEHTELFIMETLWDKQRFEASTYSLHATSLYFTCIANGNSRMYHFENMKRLIEEAGLRVVEVFEDIGVSHTIIKCMK
ncbi:MAG: methyltransferase domain-containing protein [Bacteroidales bacterium]|nr:methyltransferase domain-containing protein [Bacteroidales bacterium]